MSVNRAIPEAAGARLKRRDWPQPRHRTNEDHSSHGKFRPGV